MRFEYAAMTGGQFCFCGQTLGGAAPVDNTYCSAPCYGDAGEKCGGPEHVSVYTTPKSIDYVTLAVTNGAGQPAKMFAADEEVTFTVNITPNISNPLIMFDYEGRTGKSGPMGKVHGKSYPVPGVYTVTAYVTDFEQINPFSTARARILITGSPRTVQVSCENTYYPTNELLICDGVVREGLYMDGEVEYGNSVQETFSLKPVIWPTAGIVIPTSLPSASSIDDATQTYVQRMSFFDSAGELIAFEYYATASGDVTFAILRPSCASYCQESNQCVACTVGVRTCSSSTQYCPANGDCSDNCNSGVDLYGSAPEDYTVVKAFSYTIPDVGWGLFSVTDSGVDVIRGDVIGYSTTGAGRLAFRDVDTGEISDSNPTLTLADGNSASDVSSSTATNTLHYMRAIASRPSGVKLINTYTTPGTYSIKLTATSRYQLTAVLNSTTVILQDKISNMTLLCPTFGQINVETAIPLDQHTGTDASYTWWVDGIGIKNTTSPELLYTFTGIATYNITVRGINRVSEQWTWCTIEVQDRIVNVQASSSKQSDTRPQTYRSTDGPTDKNKVTTGYTDIRANT
ncbi:hypothetical protein LSH36_628g03069 [Paralvinella palmiformis]|uniref:WSC domain-containing protein n=1 Tax=Paralvinella palmiformis TaxID=53620 RepID=A0AAD9J5R5_9ANNE|nr:hypothetical protein LSH36_628g03069 [Paralvinella palmiformis]